MNKMKKLVFTTIGILIAVGVFALIFALTIGDIRNQRENNPQEISGHSSNASSDASESSNAVKQDFVIFGVYMNMHNDYQIDGILIDNEGKRIKVDLSDENDFAPVEELYNSASLKASAIGVDKFDYISPSNIYSICEVIKGLKDPIEMVKTDLKEKKGITTLYGIKFENNKPEFVKLGSFGDVVEIPNQRTARTVYNLIVDAERKFKNSTVYGLE